MSQGLPALIASGVPVPSGLLVQLAEARNVQLAAADGPPSLEDHVGLRVPPDPKTVTVRIEGLVITCGVGQARQRVAAIQADLFPSTGVDGVSPPGYWAPPNGSAAPWGSGAPGAPPGTPAGLRAWGAGAWA